jgi:SAM-dependent methyltransferase
VVDPIFAERRLAQVYDPLDPDRSDLDVYAALADEFGARSVLDIGCGTGTFACLLANRGLAVTAVDPAAASLELARTKPGADRVLWIHGYPTDLPPLKVDLVTMTANVAQVFLTDDDWATTLRAAYTALRPGGRLVFETRNPAARAWLEWNRERSHKQAIIPGTGHVEAWVDMVDINGELVSFRWTFVFQSDGVRLTSDSTLRFRAREEVTASLVAAGFVVDEVRDAPDRPGREMVFIAVRSQSWCRLIMRCAAARHVVWDRTGARGPGAQHGRQRDTSMSQGSCHCQVSPAWTSTGGVRLGGEDSRRGWRFRRLTRSAGRGTGRASGPGLRRW